VTKVSIPINVDEFVKWFSIESTLEFKENSTKVLVLFNNSMNNGTIKLLCDIGFIHDKMNGDANVVKGFCVSTIKYVKILTNEHVFIVFNNVCLFINNHHGEK
jgi:hypothetical protein